MTKKEFLKEFSSVKNQNAVDRVKNLHSPVMIYGAGIYAEILSNLLKKRGIEILGFAVDSNYYKSNQFYLGLPIFNFDEISKQNKNQIFVMGMRTDSKRDTPGKVEHIKNIMNSKTIQIYDVIADKADPISYDYILENQDKFLETYNLLCDDSSKKTFLRYLKGHITEDTCYVQRVLDENSVVGEYFNDFVRPFVTKRSAGFVDCGAFIGDSIEEFVKFVDGKYSKIFSFEPDTINFAKAKNLVKEKNYKNVELFNCGVWDKKDTLIFQNEGTFSSAVSENGNIRIEVESIDNVVGEETISLIKMDIEGSELHALYGAEKTLRRSRPALTVSVYHKKEDLITIPQFIKSVYGDCKMYLHKNERLDLWDFDLYVIPE